MVSRMIISEYLVTGVVNLVAPAIRELLNSEMAGATWGPQWVDVYINAPGLEHRFVTQFGKRTEWNPEWGEERNFGLVADKKQQLSEREKMNTSEIAALKPWLIQDGEYLYPGGVYDSGISVGVSGAKGWADEAIGKILVAYIIMFAMLETDTRKTEKRMQI